MKIRLTALLLICLIAITGINLFAQENQQEEDTSQGPTVNLSYGKGEDKINPVPHFMYFVPLISPTLVDSRTSKDNNQLSKIISRNIEVSGNSFYVECEFQMWGSGTHQNTFDSTQMIKRNKGKLHGQKPLKNVLDYIKFDGEGFGIISAQGHFINSTPVVEKVVVDFSSRDSKSPVIIGLYSVTPEDGEYKYKNNYGHIVARIDTLTFEKTPANQVPRMAIKVESISEDASKNGFWGSLKGMIANFFIDPISINPKGNETMLDFGLALYKAEKIYTFPIAENLKIAVEN